MGGTFFVWKKCGKLDRKDGKIVGNYVGGKE